MFEIVILLIPLALVWLLVRAVIGRGQGFSKRLDALMRLCVADGVISSEQRESILALSATQKQGLQLRSSTWLAIFAGLFIVAGLSLIIAHNWEHIGPMTRVASYILLLFAVGEAAIRMEPRGVAFSLPLLLLWFFFPILGIGLYAQTFQLSGDPVRPYLLWLLLSLPMVWISRNTHLSILYLILLVGVIFGGGFTHNNDLSVLIPGMESLLRTAYPFPWQGYAGALALIGLGTLLSFKRLPPSQHQHMFSVGMLWLILLFFGSTSFQLKDESLLFVAASAGITLLMAIQHIRSSSLAERAPAYVASLGTTYAMSFLLTESLSRHHQNSTFGMALVFLVSLAALALWVFPFRERFSPDPKWHRLFQSMLISPLILSFALAFGGSLSVYFAAIASNLLLFLGSLGLMWHGATHGNNTHITVGICVLMLVLVTRFVDVLGDFVQGGLGFISSGVFLGFVAYALGKTRKHLIDNARRVRP